MTIILEANQTMLSSLRRNAAILCALALSCAGTAHAAVFTLTYDNTATNAIDSTIIGTGTFSYNGPIVPGAFLFSSLTGVSFSATFTNGNSFSGPPFLPLDQSLVGIEVVAVGGGVFDLVFTGSSSDFVGSLDISNGAIVLSHEPGSLAGGNSFPNLFAFGSATGFSVIGDYRARSALAVPEPAPAALLGLALAGLALVRRRRNG